MSAQYRAQQTVHISTWECGAEIELTMVVHFRVHKHIPQTMKSPEEPAFAEDSTVQFFDGKDEIKLPWSIVDRITSRDEFKSWLMSEAVEDDEYAKDQAADDRREAYIIDGLREEDLP